MVDLNAAYNEAKYLPDDALRKELEKGSGTIPGYIILAELQDRKAIRTSSAPSVKRGSIASEYMFSKGGQVAAINPFNAYVNGLKFYKRLDQTPEPETQKEEGLPSLAMPGDPMMPPELSSLVPLPPGDPNNPVVKKFASGGLATLQPWQKALLDTIAARESGGRYDILYGGRQLSSFADHPKKAFPIQSGPNAGKTSSAAGRYQFLGSTWEDQQKKLGLPDFSPASQDAAAWNLAKERFHAKTGGSLDSALLKGDLGSVATALHPTWTSLPGGIEQGQGMREFASRYSNALARPATAAGIASLPQQTAMVNAQMAQGPRFVTSPASAAASKQVAKNPGAGLLGLMMMSAAMKPQPPAPAPISGKPSKFRRDTDPEEMTALTSQTPNAYRRRRYG